ncbi:MAG TPA: amino-acid N-acetyltransferase [Gemmataceae bacterium]
MLRLTDLREILHYVPQFRDRTFVIALDGDVVADENFGNLLLDIALLRSLRIGVVLAHGASRQVRELAARLGVTPSNLDGTGITDAETLEVARFAANRVSQEILVGLAAIDQRGAAGNAVVAHPAGIRRGVDQLWTGRVERIDADMLRALLADDVIPVLPPLGCDGENHTFRLNSDAVAYEAARRLGAAKLIYLTSHPGVTLDGQLLRQLSAEDAEKLLREHGAGLPDGLRSKLEYAVRACKGGVPRVHIIDGRVQEGLLAEVFSKEGIGTLVHTNEYQAIRPATKKDLWAIYAMLQVGMETDELLQRSRAQVEEQIDDFFVFELDQHPVACGALHFYPAQRKAELACLYVLERHENQGIGARLIQYAEQKARALGATELICLSTQAINYFVHKAGFRVGTPDDLPPPRRAVYDASERRSKVLIKPLAPPPAG